MSRLINFFFVFLLHFPWWQMVTPHTISLLNCVNVSVSESGTTSLSSEL
jgi:hypothetical protein